MNDIEIQKKYNDKVEEFESSLFAYEQPICQLSHFFAPGVYLRELTMPADSVIVGHEHKTEHFNIITKGRAMVIQDDVEVLEIKAGDIFVSGPGVRKMLHILEEMTWTTIHVTEETDMDKLEEELIIKSPTWIKNTKLLEEDNYKNKIS